MLKLIHRDLFIYQGKNIYVLPFFAVFIICFLHMFEAASGFSNAIISMSLYAFFMTTQLTFGCDETTKFNRFLRATPISVKTIILSRYASCLLSAVVGVLMLFIFGILTNAVSVFYPALRNNMSVGIDLVLFCFILQITICAILFPILFKFDYTKAKYPIMLLLIAAGSSLPMLISDAAVIGLSSFISLMSTGMYLGLTALSIAVLYGSITLSIAIFKRKEV